MFYQPMCDVLISPSMDAQIKKRSALYKRRNESPSFRDILRERCQSRFKASRRALLNEFRQNANKNGIRDALVGILQEELKMLKEGMPEMRDVEYEEDSSRVEEVNAVEEQWLLNEYDNILEEESLLLYQSQNEVICPLCEKSPLLETNGTIYCRNCTKQFPPGCALSQLKGVLELNVRNHNMSCEEDSQFALISENNSSGLYQLCDTCGMFSHLF